MTPNLKAFLDMLAYSELGAALLANPETDNGYKVMVGSTPGHPLLFQDYSTHPRIHNSRFNSDAAGRYQLLGRYFSPYATLLHLPDFSPDSQDKIAIQQINESHGLPWIEEGAIPMAIAKTAHLWASLPGAGYGQHENDIDDLLDAYRQAGGTLG